MTKSPAKISNEGAVTQFKVLNPLSLVEVEITFSEKTLNARNSHMGGQNQRSQNLSLSDTLQEIQPRTARFLKHNSTSTARKL